MEELINSDLSWIEACTGYVEWLKFSGTYTDATINSRKHLISNFTKYCEGKGVIKPAKINKVLIVEYFKAKKIRLSTRSIQQRLLSHFVNYLENNYVIIENPVELLEYPKIRRKERIIPTNDEIKKLYVLIEKNKCEEIKLRDKIMVDLLLSPALRITELVNIKVCDIHFSESAILITRKGGNQQKVPIPEATLNDIAELLGERINQRNAPLFLRSKKYNGELTGLGVRGAQKIINKYALASFDLDKSSYGPHLLRHKGATELAKNTSMTDVQKILGHKDITTTMIYQHPDTVSMARAINQVSLDLKEGTSF